MPALIFLTPRLQMTLLTKYTSKCVKIIGATILRISKMREKWVAKLSIALDSSAQTTEGTSTSRLSMWSKKYAMFLLPFITVLREGLECVVFVGGVSFAAPATSFPLPVITGLLGGSAIGWLIYKGGNTIRLQWFLIASTCVLYLVAAGLLSRAAWSFDMYQVCHAEQLGKIEYTETFIYANAVFLEKVCTAGGWGCRGDWRRPREL